MQTRGLIFRERRRESAGKKKGGGCYQPLSIYWPGSEYDDREETTRKRYTILNEMALLKGGKHLQWSRY